MPGQPSFYWSPFWDCESQLSRSDVPWNLPRCLEIKYAPTAIVGAVLRFALTPEIVSRPLWSIGVICMTAPAFAPIARKGTFLKQSICTLRQIPGLVMGAARRLFTRVMPSIGKIFLLPSKTARPFWPKLYWLITV
jgi:hypothetical protein